MAGASISRVRIPVVERAQHLDFRSPLRALWL